jgi:hypothetical protein
MAVRYYKTGGKRYYVIDVQGQTITPGSDARTTPSGRFPIPATYAVLDRDWAHREMAVFSPQRGRTSRMCKAAAEKLADELNRKDR